MALRTEVEQLRTALVSRATIQQANGVLAERHGWRRERAFDR